MYYFNFLSIRCQRAKGQLVEGVRFYFDGRWIEENDTPYSLQMINSDTQSSFMGNRLVAYDKSSETPFTYWF